jgi:heme exporter protein CcmD
MRSHEFYLWMSYGMTALAIGLEVVALALRRRRAMKRVEEERELESQD